MRQALNNLQATHSGFGFISPDNVFKVCDQPHPLVVKEMLQKSSEGNIDEAHEFLESLWKDGYAASDIIGTMYRIARNMELEEYLKLEFIKV
jgi:replication factor C subunit 2/4